MKPAKSAGKKLVSPVEILDKTNKLAHMWLQNTVFTVDNIKSSFMSRFFKWKKKDLLCFLQIDRRAGRKNGNTQTVDDGFFDTFEIVHAGNDIEVTGSNTDPFEKKIHFFLSAGAFFTDNDRIFDKIFERHSFVL